MARITKANLFDNARFLAFIEWLKGMSEKGEAVGKPCDAGECTVARFLTETLSTPNRFIAASVGIDFYPANGGEPHFKDACGSATVWKFTTPQLKERYKFGLIVDKSEYTTLVQSLRLSPPFEAIRAWVDQQKRSIDPNQALEFALQVAKEHGIQ